jgi:PAS domain S-box-containing protein
MDLSLDKLLADKENLERILDSLMEGIIAHDMERRMVYFNREAERITGYERTEILGRGCREVLASCAEGDARVRKGWWRA